MPDGLWWLPSLFVFGAAAVGLVLAVVGFRRLGARRERIDASSNTELETRARGLLVRADDALASADDEIAFASAEFGENAVADYARTVQTARGWMREAFLLQQRLDDAVPDTAAERRAWTKRIEGLCSSVLSSLDTHASDFASRRAAERQAPRALPATAAAVAALEVRFAPASRALDELAARFGDDAVVDYRTALEVSASALATARRAADDASERLDRSLAEPTAGLVADANTALDRARAELERAERAEIDLDRAASDRTRAVAGLQRSLDAARVIRDRHDDADMAARLNSAIERYAPLPVQIDGDPVAVTTRLREAEARLDAATAEARSAQDRLDNARAALDGAVRIARSQIDVAHRYIGGHRGAVGSEARTRLAEAERQLTLASAESDPVSALDAARRATTLATDADALARYDAGYGRSY
ncbi:hypothetical protein [Agromyces atrinae]|uniref:TPM domain-containing protein n=1 Tax=Agromyces atrinae TaxID=592376 RepID=A0A4V1R2L4_9MICO|nr:hypothetical protein [Agromyces atrinae]NYD66921.1 hypothetical protein [Agromyces atrinae]RXZ87566.1 hypothetical protein ESP50_06535 [Agromyces atrinae]